MIFRNRKFALQLLPQIGGVDHGRVFVDCIRKLFRGKRENQFRSGQPDGAIKCASPAHHDDFMLQTRSIGQLPDVPVIGAGHARSRCGRHGAGGA